MTVQFSGDDVDWRCQQQFERRWRSPKKEKRSASVTGHVAARDMSPWAAEIDCRVSSTCDRRGRTKQCPSALHYRRWTQRALQSGLVMMITDSAASTLLLLLLLLLLLHVAAELRRSDDAGNHVTDIPSAASFELVCACEVRTRIRLLNLNERSPPRLASPAERINCSREGTNECVNDHWRR